MLSDSNYISVHVIRAYDITCGMIVSLERRSRSPIVAISIPSIKILPPALSRMRNKAKVRDDFPAPVRPTTPICKKKKTYHFVARTHNDKKEK